ncbi:hypothetical protein FACS1894111_07600 [Clostridia bacterium]|nr:hypothetical protein FACS1894111_07600 [Clostridia bacterium]
MQTNNQNIRLTIGGMTCINCQNKIEKKLSHTPGISSVTVSYRSGFAQITYDTAIISEKDIRSIVEKLGYEPLPDKPKPSADIGKIAGILAIIVLLYALLETSGLLNLLVPNQLADTKMGYGMLFVIGLFTSIHCIVMCGGINLSQCIPKGATASGIADSDSGSKPGNKARYSTDSGNTGKNPAKEEASLSPLFAPALLYNLGRVVSYTVIGLVLGFIGMLLGGNSGAGLSVTVQGILKLIAGVVLVIMGINMLGFFPILRRFQPQLPTFLTKKVAEKKVASKSPLIVGLLNGFMPCGPLQSMQVIALASGNPLVGATSMFLFSLGTVPLMLGLGSIVSILGKKFTQKVMKVGSVLLVVLGLAMLTQGVSLAGLFPTEFLYLIMIALCALGIISLVPFKRPTDRSLASFGVIALTIVLLSAWNTGSFGGSANAPASGTTATEGNLGNTDSAAADTGKDSADTDKVQLIASTLSANGRYPNITVEVGTPVKWTLTAPAGSISGCNAKLNIKTYGISNFALKPGDNIIEFTPTKTGEVPYSCWMGMIRAKITVVPAGTATTGDSGENSLGNTLAGDGTTNALSTTSVSNNTATALTNGSDDFDSDDATPDCCSTP